MATREDFEIYRFLRNGRQWYGFKVDYWGRYSAPTEKLILKKRKEVQEQVRKKLAWIEEENQKYYARLAEEERQRALLLHSSKEAEKQIMALCETEDKKERTQAIYALMELGYSNQDIQLATNVSPRVISRIRYEYNKKP